MIIVMANQKGGVGKTTTGLNIAATLQSVGVPRARKASALTPKAPVIYVDTDKQLSGRDVVEESARALAGEATAKGPALNGVDISTGEPIGLPFDFYSATDVESIAKIPHIVAERGYRHAVVDTAGSLDDLSRSEAALDIADFALVPMLAEELSRKPTKRTIETMIRPRLGEQYAVVIVNYENRNGDADLIDTADWVVEQGFRLINTPVRSWRLIARKTVVTVGRSTRPALEAQAEYQKVAAEILGA